MAIFESNTTSLGYWHIVLEGQFKRRLAVQRFRRCIHQSPITNHHFFDQVLDLDLSTHNKKMADVGLILAVRCTLLSTHRHVHTPSTPHTRILRNDTVCGSRNSRHEHILDFNRRNGLEAAMSFHILPAMKAHEGPCWEGHRFTIGLISA